MPKTIAVTVTVLMFLAGSIALGRGIIWDGEYQSVAKGANMKRAAATIRLAGDTKQPSGYECVFEWEGKERIVTFALTQCTRTGSHVICTSTPQTKEPFTGDMCWGELYLKTPHPTELVK
jgi:hypothetical protein